MEVAQSRSLMVTIRASVDPIVPERIVITLTQHPINPAGESETETTSSITGASHRVTRWLSEFAESSEDETHR